jgi:hypothetical protein
VASPLAEDLLQEGSPGVSASIRDCATTQITKQCRTLLTSVTPDSLPKKTNIGSEGLPASSTSVTSDENANTDCLAIDLLALINCLERTQTQTKQCRVFHWSGFRWYSDTSCIIVLQPVRFFFVCGGLGGGTMSLDHLELFNDHEMAHIRNSPILAIIRGKYIIRHPNAVAMLKRSI